MGTTVTEKPYKFPWTSFVFLAPRLGPHGNGNERLQPYCCHWGSEGRTGQQNIPLQFPPCCRDIVPKSFNRQSCPCRAHDPIDKMETVRESVIISIFCMWGKEVQRDWAQGSQRKSCDRTRNSIPSPGSSSSALITKPAFTFVLFCYLISWGKKKANWFN